MASGEDPAMATNNTPTTAYDISKELNQKYTTELLHKHNTVDNINSIIRKKLIKSKYSDVEMPQEKPQMPINLNEIIKDIRKVDTTIVERVDELHRLETKDVTEVADLEPHLRDKQGRTQAKNTDSGIGSTSSSVLNESFIDSRHTSAAFLHQSIVREETEQPACKYLSPSLDGYIRTVPSNHNNTSAGGDSDVKNNSVDGITQTVSKEADGTTAGAMNNEMASAFVNPLSGIKINEMCTSKNTYTGDAMTSQISDSTLNNLAEDAISNSTLSSQNVDVLTSQTTSDPRAESSSENPPAATGDGPQGTSSSAQSDLVEQHVTTPERQPLEHDESEA